jgi:hypothetical protein
MAAPARIDPLLQALRGDAAPARPGTPPPAAKVRPLVQLKPGDIEVGRLHTGVPIGLSIAKVIDGRLLIQGVSGAGKSWTLRRLLEQTVGQIQQIVIDPEGEFRSFAEDFGIIFIDGAKLDIATLALAAQRAREHRTSVVLDLSDLELDEQMQAATAFLKGLMDVPKAHWHPVLVAIDEAQRFAPHGGYYENSAVKKASVAAVADIMVRGRKRGIGAVIATHRLAQLAKAVGQPVLNFMIGMNTLDLDIRRAADTIGWAARKAFDQLPQLAAGEFIGTGPAFSLSPTSLHVGPIQSRHIGATPDLTAPRKVAPAEVAKLLDLDALLATSAADQAAIEERAQPPALRALRMFIRDKAFPDAGRVFGELTRLQPNGARVADLAKHLNRKPEQIADALALLDKYAAVEFDGEGAKCAVRVAPGFFQ